MPVRFRPIDGIFAPNHRFMLRFTLFVLTFSFASTALAIGPSSGGSSADPDGQRPQSTQVGFFELMESGGEAFIDLFRTRSEEGTVESPKWDAVDSPQTTTLTFVEAMNHLAMGREEVWPRVKKTFDPDAELEDPRATANDLLAVFDRLPELSPSSLPDKIVVKKNQISRYELFPRGIDTQFVYRVLDDSPAGSIVLQKQGDDWVFTAATLRGVDDLLASLKKIPPRHRSEQKGALFASIVQPTFTETAATGWLRAILVLVISLAVAWGIGWGLSALANRLDSSGNLVVGPVLRGTRTSLMILAVTLGLMIGSANIHFEPALSHLRWQLLQALFILALIWLIVSLIELLVVWVRVATADDDDPYAKMLSTIIRRSLRIFAIAVLIIFVLQNVFAWNVTALLGGLGILALAVSLAAKDAVANLFGTITIFANRPFVVGDWVRFKGEWGEIEDVATQVTEIRLLTGELWTVPNMMFISNPVENLSERRFLRRIMNLSLKYGTDHETILRAKNILQEILRSDPIAGQGQADLEAHPPKVTFEKFAAYSLELRCDYWYMMDPDGNSPQRDTERGYLTYLDHVSLVNETIAKRFGEAEIDFAFPTQTIELQRED